VLSVRRHLAFFHSAFSNRIEAPVSLGFPTEDELVESALGLAKLGLSTFPLLGFRPDGSCRCGRRNCAAVGNHPAVRWKTQASCDPQRIVRMFRRRALQGIGLVMGSGLLVVDVDPRNGGDQSLQRLIVPLDDRHRLIGSFAVYTGLRKGELQALGWENVDLDAGILRVEHPFDPKVGLIAPKSESGRRRVPIPQCWASRPFAIRCDQAVSSRGRPEVPLRRPRSDRQIRWSCGLTDFEMPQTLL